MEKDEISMSWNKKVSLKEIAQFYENKLRELDAKQNMLEQEIENALQKIGQKTQELENSIENIKKFVDGLNETQEYIKNLNKEFNEKNQSLGDRIEFFDKFVTSITSRIGILENALREFITHQIIKNEELDLSEEFILNAVTPKSIEYIQNFIKYIKTIQTLITTENIKDINIIEDLEKYLKHYFDTFNNITSIIHPDEQYYKFLTLYIIKSFQEFLSRHEKILMSILDFSEDNKVVFKDWDNHNLFNDYFNNIYIKKNKIKDGKEGVK